MSQNDRSVLGRGFSMCFGEFTPGEIDSFDNTGDAHANQVVYLFFGNVTASQNGKIIQVMPKSITDMSSFVNTPYSTVAGNDGAYWMAINPIPATKKYNIEIAQNGISTIQSTTKECVIVCADGSITVNSKLINKEQFTRVIKNNSVTLNVPEGSIAFIMTA
jgi:hypothetical protein